MNSPEPPWNAGPSYAESDRPLARLVARPVREFLHVESSGSIVLLLAALGGLIWANSPWADSYDSFWHTEIGLDLGFVQISESLQHWVNDALMVVFFFVVGLEIKYELVSGDLRHPRTAALPVIAAVGGMVVPAGLYLLVTGGGPDSAGWGIPMATDIAFALGVLGLLGSRIPSAARLFLLTLAVVDDIGAIVVIALFYTEEVSLPWLAGAAVLLLAMVGLRMLKVWTVWAYGALGVVLWFAMLQSGVHPTLAGVAVGLLAPGVALLKEDVSRGYAQQALADRHLDAEELERLRFLLTESVPVVDRLQSRFHPVSAYLVLPVFALANAGVHLGGGALGDAVSSPVAQGIVLGLVVGKPLGIALACWLAIRTGLGRLPDGTSWVMLAGLGAVAGIGFTVSLFIAGLAFPGEEALVAEAKVAILAASLVAAAIGVVVLLVSTRAEPAASER